MKLLEGVLLHELILILLGLMVGLALLFAFMRTVHQNKPNLKLIYAFSMPLMMIGYPSIQRVQFENGVINIDKVSKEVEKNQLDTVLQKQLLQNVHQLSAARMNESPSALSAVANAQVALGRYDAAQALIHQAAQLDSTSAPVVTSKQRIKKKTDSKKQFDQKVKQFDKQLKSLEKQPHNKVVRDSIAQALKEVSAESVSADEQSLITIATAAVVSGHSDTAIDLIDKVLKVNPSKEAQVLRAQIVSGDILKKYNSYALPSPSNKPPKTSVVEKPNAPDKIVITKTVSDTGVFSIRAVPNAILRFF
jgi:tetratricopeptide (TPR) repeat protein